MKSQQAKRVRKQYQAPQLKKYGDLRRLTTGAAKGGIAQDGGAGGPKSKLTGNIQ
jgi:hypothetical protein